MVNRMGPSNSLGTLSPYGQGGAVSAPGGGTNLADVLERVLDKGVVIAGDIQINLLDIELLTIKLRLVVASVDTARRMGIRWWESDPMLAGTGEDDPRELRKRINRLERELEEKRELEESHEPADGDT
jgi:Gas vesicle protein